MTNKEKYKDEILEVAFHHDKVAFDKEEGKVKGCVGFACRNCLFNEGNCFNTFTNWLEQEYVEPLKPCPFCGFKKILYYPNPKREGQYTVYCPNCSASAGSRVNKSNAIKAWNMRHDEEICD